MLENATSTGIDNIVDEDNKPFPVYCDFGSESGAAWTLIQSCSLRNFLYHFKRRPFYAYNHNYNKIVKSDWLSTALISALGCVRLGNPDLDFQNLNPDFPIEREIRKRISPPRNPSSRWISIKKPKSGFFGFPFYRSIGKSQKGFAKLFS